MRGPATLACAFALAYASAGPVLAQDKTSPDDFAQTAGDAVATLRDAATEKVLIRDLLGQDVTGPSGRSLGTVENFAMIPGGRLVAIVLQLTDGDRVALPYQVLTVSTAAETLELSVPMDTTAILNDARVDELSGLLGL